ncbi:hypothetical protein [Paenibacillus sp. NPDC055715]
MDLNEFQHFGFLLAYALGALFPANLQKHAGNSLPQIAAPSQDAVCHDKVFSV